MELGDDRRLVAALAHVLLERLEGGDVREGVTPRFRRGDMDEADTVVELEGRIAQPVGLGAVELLVDSADELLVLGNPVRLDPVANHHASHLRLLSDLTSISLPRLRAPPSRGSGPWCPPGCDSAAPAPPPRRRARAPRRRARRE